MKVLTIREPYVSPIAKGLKHYETRSWKTNYRGEIFIHTAKARLPSIKGHESIMPLGCIVLKANLTDCIEMTERFIKDLDETERSLGFYEVGRFAWKLEDVELIDPVKVNGKLGIWNYEMG